MTDIPPPADRLAHHCFTMACNNAWANTRLLGACRALPADAFTAPRPSVFGSLQATVHHILTVDRFYVDALERALSGRPPHPQPGVFFDPEQPSADAAAFEAAQGDVDRRLIALCRTLTAARLQTPVRILRRWGVARDPASRTLAPLFQHQIHHRGQIHGMLSASGHAPPQLDEFFCIGDAANRADDLAAMGLSEAAIWPEVRCADGESEAIVRRYLSLIAAGGPTSAVAALLHPEMQQIEYAHALDPVTRTRDRDAVLAGLDAGARTMASQTYGAPVLSVAGDTVTAEFDWSGTTAIALGPWPRGTQLSARICAIIRLREGRIVAQRNYDCYRPPAPPAEDPR